MHAHTDTHTHLVLSSPVLPYPILLSTSHNGPLDLPKEYRENNKSRPPTPGNCHGAAARESSRTHIHFKSNSSMCTRNSGKCKHYFYVLPLRDLQNYSRGTKICVYQVIPSEQHPELSTPTLTL